MRVRPWVVTFSALVLVVSSYSLAYAQKAAEATTAKEGVLKATEVGDKLFPDKVFFRGQSASVQARNMGGQTLKPGAYGIGFIEGSKLVVMDLGANDVFQVGSTKDSELKRPVPLQFAAGSAAGTYRLYKGRDYVEFHRVK